MDMALFHHIVDEMTPHVASVHKVDLFGLGEPLLDPHLFERIRHLKGRGFRNLAISSNANLLSEDKARELLDSGIETVILSIDGVRKKTHEGIRRGSDFERIVENTERLIRRRDEGGFATRFILRFIRQEANREEWEPFKRYWNARLSREKRDFVARYDVHNNAGTVMSKDQALGEAPRNEAMETAPCRFIFECLIILADGTVSLCHPDFHQPGFGLGRIPEVSPIEAFNSEAFARLRALHAAGRKREIALCRECTVPYCEHSRERGWDVP